MESFFAVKEKQDSQRTALLYAEECRLRGCQIDRCQLYLYRAVVYFVNTENPDPAKCKWWLWKDRPAAEADPERK